MTDITVAFQGEHGAYSEQAIFQHFGEKVKTLPCVNFGAIYRAVQEREADHGVLPVENSLAGTVIPAYDVLIDQDLRVQGEVILSVRHCLMAPRGAALADIKFARSHHQALAQTAHTLRRLGLEPQVYYDTAGSARDLAREPVPHTAAVASALAAETYDLEILAQDIQAETWNYTRFFVLGADDLPQENDKAYKTSMILTTRHVPGALYKVIGELATRGINMSKLESRPRRNRPWHYYFFIDFDGHEDDKNVQQALLAILRHSSFLKVLGSFEPAER